MATKKLHPVYPRDILKNDFLEPLDITPYRLAKQLGMSRSVRSAHGGAISRRK
jgi:plasmid maintenance system antidote protein VapI